MINYPGKRTSNEMNFFKPYLAKDKSGQDYSKVVITTVAGITAAILLFYGITSADIYLVNRDTKAMNAIMTEKVFAQKITHFNEVKRKLDALGQYDAVVGKLNSDIGSTYIISSEYLDAINKTLPQDSFLQAYRVRDGAVEIQGVTANRTAIAECEHNLIQSNLFSKVFVTNIGQQAGTTNYLFMVKCISKGWVEKK